MANALPPPQEDKDWAREQFGLTLKGVFARGYYRGHRRVRYSAAQLARTLRDAGANDDFEISDKAVQEWANGTSFPRVIEPVVAAVAKWDTEVADKLKYYFDVGQGAARRARDSDEPPQISLDWDERTQRPGVLSGVQIELLRPFKGNQPGEVKVNAKLYFGLTPYRKEDGPRYLIGVRAPELRILSDTHTVSAMIGDDALPHTNFATSGTRSARIKPLPDTLGRVIGDPLRDPTDNPAREKSVADMQPSQTGEIGKIELIVVVDQDELVVSQKAADGTERLVRGDGANPNRKAVLAAILAKETGMTDDGFVILAGAAMTYRPRSDVKR